MTPGASRTQSKSHLKRGQLEPFGRPDDRLHDPTAARLQIGLDEPGEVIGRRPGAPGGAVPVLPGQHAASERRPRKEAHPKGSDGGQHLDLGPPREQGILDLSTDDRRPPGNARCHVAA